MKRILAIFLITITFSGIIHAQDIPQHISYYRIYELLDEFANEGLIDLNSAIKPYSRKFIADQLQQINARMQDDQFATSLSRRQKAELKFFLNEFAPELGKLPDSKLKFMRSQSGQAALWPPAYHYSDSIFSARITPILGMHLISNQNGTVDKRWYGAEFQGIISKNIAVYGSLRDISNTGDGPLSGPTYLNDEPGYEYTAGADFSDSRGGITYANKYFSIGLKKDNIMWGDNNHGSNILSGRAPSFPMIYLQLKPATWFELNYFHGWLVSNVLDSTNYYTDNVDKIFYRPQNKYMAANMFTFTPINKLKLSIGNSIVYAERNVVPSFLIPIAFYKSMDHVMTKGLGAENQNSQLFMNISSRNIKHLHLYSSLYIDEFQLRRMLPDSPDRNPMSLKLGAQITNFPVKNLSLVAEYTGTNIINYKHSIPALSYASNSYNLGHYLGDNSREIYAALQYKPLRGLDFQLSYCNALHGNDYEYIRHGYHNNTKASIVDIISNPSPGDIIWTSELIGFKTTYEVFQNAYALVKVDYANIQGFDASTETAFGENRLTAQQALDKFTPKMLQGKHMTVTVGFSLGF